MNIIDVLKKYEIEDDKIEKIVKDLKEEVFDETNDDDFKLGD